MARKTFYITREQKNPLYPTRMLQAGPIELNTGVAALYRKLGVKISDNPPAKAPPQKTEAYQSEVETVLAKPAPRKRTRKAK
jgi:hypothetical protein